MGYSLIKQNDSNTYDLKEFVCDKIADIETLPKSPAPGSTCICIEDATVWILSTEKVWIKL